MMPFTLKFVRSPKKFNEHLCHKVPFVLPCFQASAAPRPENSDADEEDALFGLDTKITILNCHNPFFPMVYHKDFLGPSLFSILIISSLLRQCKFVLR
jgi:hypothetical protein